MRPYFFFFWWDQDMNSGLPTCFKLTKQVLYCLIYTSGPETLLKWKKGLRGHGSSGSMPTWQHEALNSNQKEEEEEEAGHGGACL
jgi:hypothetical protein